MVFPPPIPQKGICAANPMKVHENELPLNLETIITMVHQQYPESRSLSLDETDLGGTQNRIFRLGEDLYLRLPRMAGDTQILTETKWMEYIRPYVPVKVPVPVFVGMPTNTYPAVWAIYQWLEGETIYSLPDKVQTQLAEDLSSFIHSLHALPVPQDAPHAGRKPLKELESHIRECIIECTPYLNDGDDRILFSVLEEGLAAEAWKGEGVFIHADLLPTNILMENGRLKAILDFGSFGCGDPAFDLLPAWAVFDSPLYFKALMHPTEAEWLRSKTYAMYQALMIIPYYEKSYPEFTQMALMTLQRILSSFGK